MHDYTKHIPVKTNLSVFNGYNYFDIDTVLNNIRDNVNNNFIVKNTNYEMYVYLKRLSEYSNTLTLNIELFDEEYRDIEPKEIIKLFESETEFRNFIKNSIITYINAINSIQLKVHYFSEFEGAYNVYNNKMYAAVYDFSTNKFLPTPEVKETILKIEDPNIDTLIEKIMKE